MAKQEIPNKETRSIMGEMRAVLGDEGKKKVIGYAALFNKETELWPGFREKVGVGAFNDVLDDDVRALFNHNPDSILARTTSGTLKLSVDSKGLKYEFTPPDTNAGRDLVESIDRGDVNQSSFGFIIKESSVDEHDDGSFTRTIVKVKRLLDISPVTYPAYEDTTVALRDKERHQRGAEQLKSIKREIELLSI